MTSDNTHIPVMLNEVIEYLDLQPGDTVVDGTLGLGGHARAILERIGPAGRLIGIDQDPQALFRAEKNLSSFKNQVTLVHSNARSVTEILAELKIDRIDRMLMDLGVSSLQLDDARRGFSLREDGPLDMRMDPGNEQSAETIVNQWPEDDLALLLKNYGQERWFKRIAQRIVYEREKQLITTTEQLKTIILKAMPKGRNWQKIHPATRTFQAIRIAVNQELDILPHILEKSFYVLRPTGRLAVISFHSLEDKIVKNLFRDWHRSGQGRLMMKKPLRPTEEEININARARSARLRVIERDT